MKKSVIETLTAHAHAVIPVDDFLKKIDSGKKLVIKFGADPTSPDLHLGHAVVLSKLKEFQDAGHEIVFLIGDYTARIGDPTGRSKTRPPLTEEQIAHNSKTYLDQVTKILDPQKITIRYNSQWLDPLTSKQWLELCAKITLSRLIEREDFAKRLSEHTPIGFHELLYPLLQGYDSVVLHADVEIGGTDQTFNMLVGRFLQEQYGQAPQVVITMPLLEGLDGVAKMSKSYGNTIGLTEPADQAYGKLMSISDTLMWRYYELLLNTPTPTIAQMQQAIISGHAHPMDLKKKLAHGIVAQFWGATEADAAQKTFEELFQKKDYSNAQEVALLVKLPGSVWIVDLLKELGACKNSTEAGRLLTAGAVSINEQKVTDLKANVLITNGMVVRVGKHRFYKLT